MSWTNLFFILGAALMVWLIYRQIKHHPQAFSRENLSKSFFTLGILALILVAFIWILVVFLRASH